MPFDEEEDPKKKKKDGSEEVGEPGDVNAGQDNSVKTFGKAANQGATKGYTNKAGKFIPGAKAAPVVREEPTQGLGAVATAAAAKKRADQAAAIAGKK